MADRVEFWLDDKPILSVASSMVPRDGDIVSIRGKSYEVTSMNFAVDYSDNQAERHMRSCVNLEPIE